MIEHKITNYCKNAGIPFGTRGGCGASLIAFLAGITNTNPLPAHYLCPVCSYSLFIQDNNNLTGPDLPDKLCPNCRKRMKKYGFNIPVESFLGYRMDKEPDFDLNVPKENQADVQRFLATVKGIGDAVHAGTVRTRYDKEVYEKIAVYQDKAGCVFSSDDVSSITKAITGTRIGTGCHPGGIFVVPEGEHIEDFTPVRRAYREALEYVSEIDCYELNYALLKIDILSHEDLSLLKILEAETGVKPEKIPLKDKKIMALFSSCEGLGITSDQIGGISYGTLGVTEFGSYFMLNQILPKVKVQSFSDIIKLQGLCHGTNAWENNAEIFLAKKDSPVSLSDCIAHRDDIMLYLCEKGINSQTAFQIMEYVRKGKASRFGLKPEWKEEMRSAGVPKWYMDSCERISYLFPKAHSTGYAIIAWWLLYYKLYYPEAFYKAWFSVKAKLIRPEDMSKNTNRYLKEYRQVKKQLKQGLIDRWDMDNYMEMPLRLEMKARGIGAFYAD